MTEFQSQVNTVPAVAVAGDWASANPRHMVLAGSGGLVAGPAGAIVGRFCWAVNPSDDDGAPAQVNSFGAGAPTGLAHREQQGLITSYLASSGMVVPAGFQMSLADYGDLFVKNDGAAQALPGMKAYANLGDGKATFKAAGTSADTASVTASIAASTFSVTGSIADDVLTVTAVGSGTVVPGGTISGTGIASGTRIVRQLTGAAGGVGTYSVSIPEQVVASTAVSGTYGTMTVTAVGSGVLILNGVLSGTGVTAGTKITAFITGAGGTGTYVADENAVVSSTTVTETMNIETKWFARTAGLAGELVKVSAQALG